MGAILLQNVGGGMVWNQCNYRVDAEVTFFIYSFPNISERSFESNTDHALYLQMICILIYLNLLLDVVL